MSGALVLPAPSLDLGTFARAEDYDRGLPAEARKRPYRFIPSLPLPSEHDDLSNRTMVA